MSCIARLLWAHHVWIDFYINLVSSTWDKVLMKKASGSDWKAIKSNHLETILVAKELFVAYSGPSSPSKPITRRVENNSVDLRILHSFITTINKAAYLKRQWFYKKFTSCYVTALRYKVALASYVFTEMHSCHGWLLDNAIVKIIVPIDTIMAALDGFW